MAVITGGNSGIGFGIAEAFMKEGAVGAIVGRTQETLDSSVAKLGENFIAIRADVTKQDDLERICIAAFLARRPGPMLRSSGFVAAAFVMTLLKYNIYVYIHMLPLYKLFALSI